MMICLVVLCRFDDSLSFPVCARRVADDTAWRGTFLRQAQPDCKSAFGSLCVGRRRFHFSGGDDKHWHLRALSATQLRFRSLLLLCSTYPLFVRTKHSLGTVAATKRCMALCARHCRC